MLFRDFVQVLRQRRPPIRVRRAKENSRRNILFELIQYNCIIDTLRERIPDTYSRLFTECLYDTEQGPWLFFVKKNHPVYAIINIRKTRPLIRSLTVVANNPDRIERPSEHVYRTAAIKKTIGVFYFSNVFKRNTRHTATSATRIILFERVNYTRYNLPKSRNFQFLFYVTRFE